MKRKFTLSELLIVIAVLAVILSIVTVKYNDFKKKSISSAMNANVSIIQTAVDAYALQNESYPVKKELSLTKPQIVDVGKLVETGYIKKDLDRSRLSSQFYWVDVFGKVWGATEDIPAKVTVNKGKETQNLDFMLEENIRQYNIYEVSGYSESGKSYSYKDIEIDRPQSKKVLAASNDSNKQYKLVHSEDVSVNGKRGISFKGENKNSVYLVSVVDEYGLETVPVGLTSNSNFTPLISFEGIREFEIEGYRTMHWINFFTVENKPEGTSINYRFKVKNQNGDYGEWTNDFASLEPSKGIIVEVEMRYNDKKVKPSLFDLQIFYRFDDEIISHYPNPLLLKPSNQPNIIDLGEPNIGSDGTGEGNNSGGSSGSTTIGGSGSNNNNNGGGVSVNPVEVCPQNYITTNLNGDGTTTNGDPEKYISYLLLIPEGEMLSSIKPPMLSGAEIESTKILYAGEGDMEYVIADSIFEVPSGSCVNIVYEVTIGNPSSGTGTGGSGGSGGNGGSNGSAGGGVSIYSPPTISSTPQSSFKKVGGSIGNRLDLPEIIEDDEEWTTIEEVKFIGNSQNGSAVKWNRFEKEDKIYENTRILYYFSGFTGSSWSKATLKLNEVPSSRSALVVAKLQVKTSVYETDQYEEPTLRKMKLAYDGGETVYSPDKPLVLITPKKDNNGTRPSFSIDSNISWEVWTYDPKNSKITNIEWNGDKRNKYDEAGQYIVSVRVKNQKGIWSDWNNYTFTVHNEKPIAVISLVNGQLFGAKENPLRSTTSYDPDGDTIVNEEWEGDIRDSYPSYGEFTIRLRVQDSDGYWSEWTEKTFKADPVWVKLAGSKTITFNYDFLETVTLDEQEILKILPKGTRISFDYSLNNKNTYEPNIKFKSTDEIGLNGFKKHSGRYLRATITFENIMGDPVIAQPNIYEIKMNYKNDQGVSKSTVVYGNRNQMVVNFSKFGRNVNTYTIPADGYYLLEVHGGAGGSGGAVMSNSYGGGVTVSGAAGSKGSYVQAKVYLNEGTVLQIYQGQNGNNGGFGYNSPGSVAKYSYGGGGGGGAASLVYMDTELMLVAKGGNGGSGGYQGNTVGESNKGKPGSGGLTINTTYDGRIGITYSGGGGGGSNYIMSSDIIKTKLTSTSNSTTGKVILNILGEE